MVKYFPDGLVRTLYVGAFANGQFEDQSGNAWMIGKNKPEESYSYYKGPFKIMGKFIFTQTEIPGVVVIEPLSRMEIRSKTSNTGNTI